MGEEKLDKIHRSSMGLRDAMFDELDLLRSGASTPKRAAAASRIAAQIINSKKIEIEYEKHIQSLDNATRDLEQRKHNLPLGGSAALLDKPEEKDEPA